MSWWKWERKWLTQRKLLRQKVAKEERKDGEVKERKGKDCSSHR